MFMVVFMVMSSFVVDGKEEIMKNTISKNVSINKLLVANQERPVVRVINKGVQPTIGQIIYRPMTDAEMMKKAKLEAWQAEAIHNAEAKAKAKAEAKVTKAAAKAAAKAEEEARVKSRREKVRGIIVAYIATDGTVHQKQFATKAESEDVYAILVSKNMPTQMMYRSLDATTVVRESKNLAKEQKKLFAQAVAVAPTHIVSEYVQVTKYILNPDYMKYGEDTADQIWLMETTAKAQSDLEFVIDAMAGKPNTAIRFCSQIPETSRMWDPAAEERAHIKENVWEDVCLNGFIHNGERYFPFGHTTNGAKDAETIWVPERILRDLRKEFHSGINPHWQRTIAKDVAYTCGLQAVAVHYSNIPFMPEDVAIMPSIFEEIEDNVIYCEDDGSITRGIRKVTQNMADGQAFIHISQKKRCELINRTVAQYDVTEEQADKLLDMWIELLTACFSFRTRGAANKGLMVNCFDFHSFLKNRDIYSINGRDIDDVIFLLDESVLKTPIGDNGAFRSFEDFCDSCRDIFQLGVLIEEHEDKMKDISYQVLQTACEADPETIREIAADEAKFINSFLESPSALAKLLGREQAKVAQMIPEIIRFPRFKKEVEEAYRRLVDTSLGGRIQRKAHYAFGAMDPAYVLTKWFGLPVEHMIHKGQVMVMTAKEGGKKLVWRSPVMDPGALLIVDMVNTVPAKYRKYFTRTTNTIFFNGEDLMVTRTRGDFDGDHWMWTDYEPIIRAVEQTHAKLGDWLIDWPAVKAAKVSCLTEKDVRKYIAGLVKISELGSNCNCLSQLYGKMLDEEWYDAHPTALKPTPEMVATVNMNAVGDKTHSANVNVDSGKHGSVELKHDKAYAYAQHMLMPAPVLYAKLIKKMGYDHRDEMQEELDAIIKTGIAHPCGNLNRYLMELVKRINRLIDCDEFFKFRKPEEFDYKDLLFTDGTMRRGELTGLIAKGSWDKDLQTMLNQGLFNLIADRSAKEWAAIYNGDEASRRMSYAEFKAAVKERSLEEIGHFAVTFGKSMSEAYDYITWQMFKYAEDNYGSEKDSFTLDNLWNAYWTIFGEMAVEAAERSCEFKYAPSNLDEDCDNYEADEDDYVF